MQSTLAKLKPARDEVHKTAHDQDLIEVSKRAQLDRQSEHSKQFPQEQDLNQASTHND